VRKYTFPGGIHPPENKDFTRDKSFEKMQVSRQIILPLTQHLGKQAVPLIKKGSEVKRGMLVAEGDGFISSPVHSPVSGVVAAISREVNTSGYPKDAIIINSNGKEEQEFLTPQDKDNVTAEEIRQRVKEAGIVGQGGAAFPTYVKLTPPADKKIDAVIINGCECEPYLTRDYRFMIERPEAVVEGLALIMKALGVQKGTIGIEDNKPEAVKTLKKFIDHRSIDVVSLKTKYPQGAEKMLIKAVTGKEVPPGKLPLDVGIVIQNTGTAAAIYDAVVYGEPSVTAAMTVTGKGIKEPKNLLVPVGTPLRDVLEFCGGLTDDAVKLIVGGPMMGIAQYDFSAPVMKATSGIVVLTEDEINKSVETPCLKCGQCIEVCPLNLIPTKLSRLIQLSRYEEAEDLGITVCMECGTCAYTCPANIPLVQWLRLGKQKVFQLQKERQKAAN
jgi:Na+-translocating ferredoxin:NAD+ oxidoreductase subunit C